VQVADIVGKARESTGLADLGDSSVLEGLAVLVDASNTEARLSAAGTQRWEGSLVKFMCNRLRIVDYLKQHPQLTRRPIDRPLFVFGLPRSGTTLTINLLSADPDRRCFLRWESLDSVPPAMAGQLHTDPRCRAEQERLAMAVKYAPQIAAAHYEDADSPSECQFSMALNFCAQLFDSNVRVPSYRKWLFATSYLPTFRFHKQLLQLFLNDLTSVYPDAQLVMTHRDPAEVVGSACSLLRLVRPMFSDKIDLREIAGQLIETFDLMITRQDQYRAQHGQDSIYDILYTDQLRDPTGEMRKLYAHFNESFTPAVEAAMTRLMSANPQGKHGTHHYTLEEFGLTAAGVRKHFRGYCERFRIPQRDQSA
jgi:Sulfotransferase family